LPSAGHSGLSGFEIVMPSTRSGCASSLADFFADRFVDPAPVLGFADLALTFGAAAFPDAADLLDEARLRAAVPLVDVVRGAERFAAGGGSAAPALFECQIASGLKACRPPAMNGVGAFPVPFAICAMVRPEATERSFARTASPSLSAHSSLCLISSQLLRLPPKRSPFMRTSTKPPLSFSPARTNFNSPLASASSMFSSPSGSQ